MFLLTAFLLGLASSFHCIGMCGPIAMALPLNRSSVSSQVSGLLVYNFGRIITYSLLGILFGFIGFSLQLYRVFQLISVFFGVILIVLAWRKKWINYLEWRKSPIYGWLMKNMGQLLQKKGTSTLFMLGMLNGILPCGMIFLGLASALLAPNLWGSGLAMFAFGLGTLPGMFAVGFFAQRLGPAIRNQINKAYPYLMTLIGILVILRGSNLGIPYLSPKIEQSQQTAQVKGNEPKTVQIICHSPEKNK